MPAPLPEYLNELNDRQREGATATRGPVLVIAGAGSGKTKMLTARIVHLMAEHQVPGRHILAVTFTNKAAGEMRARATRALGLEPGALEPPPPWMTRGLPSSPTIGTFHSICARILRSELDRTSYKNQFVIYDDSDQLSLVKECFAQLNLSDKMFSPKSFQHGINEAKCAAREPGDLAGGSPNPYLRNLARVYELYERELIRNDAIDFGGIITAAYRLFRDNADVLERYQGRFQYIHVDEYQDTNRAQYLLVNILASGHRNLCVVGDEDQSIYRWRGADIRNILDFEKDYPEAKVVKLEQNYRSTQTIINASSRVISRNSSRKAKTLWTANEVGERIRRFQVSDDRAEAELVVAQMKQECAASGYSFSDAAIFYRTNAQSRVFEDVLGRERVPYRIVGGLRFYDRKEIKDVLAYFRVLLNGSDSVSMKRIINVPQRAIGKATVEKVEQLAVSLGVNFEEGLRQAAGGGDTLAAAARRKVSEFLSLVGELRGLLPRSSLSALYHELLDRTGYIEELRRENTEESLSRIENLQEFDSILEEFETSAAKAAEGQVAQADVLLPAFLENAALVNERQENENAESQAGSISLMTLHTSKGLEFPLVFMVGVEEGLFPSIRPYEEESDEDIEEERRLCYVGMTRAKRRLYMTHAVCRRVYGNIVYHDPARFFQEMPEELVEFTDLTRLRMRTASAQSRPGTAAGHGVPRDYASYAAENEAVGKRVRHATYGVGVIRGVEGEDHDAKLTIEFTGRVVKKFIAKFANLEYL